MRLATTRRSGRCARVLACFEVAAALGYLPEPDAALRARFDRVLGTLVRVSVRQ